MDVSLNYVFQLSIVFFNLMDVYLTDIYSSCCFVADHETAGMITYKHVYEIAKIKARDPPQENVEMEEICRLIMKQCKTIGVDVVDKIDPEEYGKFLQDRKAVVDTQLKELEEKKQAKMLRTAAT
jgi:hypothetical protein